MIFLRFHLLATLALATSFFSSPASASAEDPNPAISALPASASPSSHSTRLAPNVLAAAPDNVPAGDWQAIVAAHQTARRAMSATASGHRAWNPRQQWHTAFDGQGALTTPERGGWTWGLALRGYGLSGTEKKRFDVPALATASGARLTYRWDACVEEWFVNDDRGLEHGFTLHHRPAALDPAHELVLELAVLGDLRAQPQPDGLGLQFIGATGETVLNYTDLKAWDADGRALPAQLRTSETGVEFVVDDTHAHYPLTIDPIAQQAYLKHDHPDNSDYFGYAVAMSGDTAVVGAVLDDSNATGVNGSSSDNSASDSGAVFVFVRSGSSWLQQAYLKAANSRANFYFGYAVAIDGDTILVGAATEPSNATGVNGDQTNSSAPESGAAFIFTRSGTTWTQQAYLKPSNTAAYHYYGTTAAISGDTAVVGASGDDSAATGVNGNAADTTASGSGAAFVYFRSGTAWTQQAYLKPSNTLSGQAFGSAVGVSADTVIVGAPFESSSSTGVNGNQNDNSSGSAGAAYVFTRSGTTWSQQAYLKASNTGGSDIYGSAVAIDGDSLVVGAPNEGSNATGTNGDGTNNTASGSGAAYVYTRSGTTWSQQAYLKASNTNSADKLATSVAISGNRILLGAPNESSNATGIDGNTADNSLTAAGAAYLYQRSGTTWSQANYLKASNTGDQDEFGYAVALSGNTALIGARGEWSGINGNPADNSAQNAGAAYLFAFAPPVITSGLTASGIYGTAITPYSIIGTQSPTAYSATGLPPGLAVNSSSGQITGTPTDTTGSPYTVTIGASNSSGTDTASLVFTIGKAALIVTGDTKSRAYGAANPTLTATITGFKNSDTATVVSGSAGLSASAMNTSAVGPYTIITTVGTLTATNYTIAAANGVLTVSTAPLTVTADPQSRVYGAANPTFTAVVIGFVNSETAAIVTGSASFSTTATGTSAPGPYPITPAAGTLAAPNYAFITFVPGTLTLTQASQTITFPTPSGRYTSDGPFTPSATASSGLTVNFSVVSGPATASSNVVTLTGATGTVTLHATQSGNANYTAGAPVDRTFAVTVAPVLTAAPTISQQPADQNAKAGASVVFTVSASGNPSPSYLWRRNGVALAGQTDTALVFGNLALSDSGASFDVVVSNSAGSVTSRAATLTVSSVVSTDSVFTGPLGDGGRYSLFVHADGTAVFIGYLPNGKRSFIAEFIVAANGSFSTPISITAAATATAVAPGVDHPALAAVVSASNLSGFIRNGQVLGQIDSTGEAFNGAQQTSGPTLAFTGLYEAPLVNSSWNVLHLIVNADGSAFSATTVGGVTQVTVGTVSASGQFTVQIDAATTIQGSLTAAGTLTGQTVVNGTPSTPLLGTSTAVAHTDRLVNISTRGIAGDNDRIIIAGFVVSGDQPKSVLIRAVGPGLTALGVDGVMENPVLTLYRGSQVLAINDDWGTSADAAAIASVASRVGAFPLATSSKDAALLSSLAPGGYTAQITRAVGSTNGVALVEIYDAATNPGTEAQKLINISARGEVRAGSGVLIGGFVVTGNFPKKVLIRGVGPSLTRLGLSSPLSNPVLRLYQGSTVIATNDDWMSDDAPAIATAAAQAGAFALDSASKDSALFLTLAPGTYTAQVSGADNATGIALLEVYEVP